MSTNKKRRLQNKAQLTKKSLVAVLGLSSLILIVVMLLSLAGADNDTVSAKDNDKDKKPKDAKSLQIVAVDRPTSFQGSNPRPTFAGQGQELIAVKIDFDRNFKDHLRSSEAGEVYLTDANGTTNYYTVDTAVQSSDGPGKKPARQATFVFSVPKNSTNLIFHYGTRYSLPLK